MRRYSKQQPNIPDLSQTMKMPLLDLMLQRAIDKIEEPPVVEFPPNPYEKYAAFGERAIELFWMDQGGVVFTPDVVNLFRSIWTNKQTIGKSGNSVGKTHAIAHAAVAVYCIFEDAKVFTLAAPPVENLERLIWGEIVKLQGKYPHLFESSVCTSMRIARRDERLDSYITGIPVPQQGTDAQKKARASGKHAPHLFFFVDEADAIDAPIFAGIDTCMTSSFARLCMTFNPREEFGPVYDKEAKGLAKVCRLGAITHPNVVEGRDVFPGAVDRNTTLVRIHNWTRPMVKEDPVTKYNFEVPEYLVGCTAINDDGSIIPPLETGWRVITNPEFSHVVMGEYPPQGSQQLYSSLWVAAARTRYDLWVAQYGDNPPPETIPVMGQDVGEYGEDPSVTCTRWGGFVKFDWWTGVDPVETAKKCYDIWLETQANFIFVDGNGVGASVAPQLETMHFPPDTAKRVMTGEAPDEVSPMGQFGLLRDQLLWAVREWLRTDNTAMLPPDEELLNELKVMKYTVEKKVIHVDSKKVIRPLLRGKSTNKLDALALTFASQERDYAPLSQSNYRSGRKGKHKRTEARDANYTYNNKG